MFEQASRLKIRYQSPKGPLSVEDLWVLPLATLDVMAIALNKQLTETSVSFLRKDNDPDAKLKLSFDIIRHVMNTRLAEQERIEKARYKAQEKQKLLEVLSRKQDAKLETMSEEDIRALIDKLSD